MGPPPRPIRALAPDEALLRDAALGVAVPGDVAAEPSLGGWTDGPAAAMPEPVRHALTHGLRMPRAPEDLRAERARWAAQAEPAVWVRARLALLDERLGEAPGDGPAA